MTEYVKTTDNFNTWRIKTNDLRDFIGELSSLTTTNKNNLVGAVNEIKQILTDLNVQISDLDLTETLQLINSILDGISGGNAEGYPTDTFNTKLQVRRAFEYEWLEANPVLADGEPSINKSNGKIKIGNGVSNWADLPYFDTLHNHDTRYVSKNTVTSGNIDFNTFVVPGQYQFAGSSGIIFSNQPVDFTRGTLIVTNGADAFYVQQLVLSQDNNVYYRVAINNSGIRTWSIWRNISNYDDLYSSITHTHSSYESSISSIETDVSLLESGLATTNSDIAAIQSSITSITSDLTDVATDINGITNDITTINGDISTIQTDVSAITNDITSMISDISDINSELSTKLTIHQISGANFNFNDNSIVNGLYQLDSTNTYTNYPSGFTSGVMILSDNGSTLYKQQLLLGNNTIYYRNSYDNSGLTWNNWNTLLLSRTTITQQTSSGNIASNTFDSLVLINSSSDITVTPTAGAFPIGFKIQLARYGTGEAIFLADTGETIVSQNSYLKINNQYDVVTLYKISSTEWLLTGNLKA